MSALALAQLRLDGGTQPRVRLSDETVGEYTEALKDGAEFPPVTAFYDGEEYWLADGFHRAAACRAVGKDAVDATIWHGSRRDAILYSVSANSTHGLPRSNADKRKAVLTLLGDAEWGRWSDREIARCSGVSAPFVGRVRSDLSVNGLQMPERTVSRAGATYTMDTAAIGQRPRDEHDELSEIERAQLAGVPEPAPHPNAHFRTTFTGECEWFTPATYLDLARGVLGQFDLDPASCAAAQERVQARTYYAREQDGLAQPWVGKVWLNPPYSQPEIVRFVERLIAEVKVGSVTEALLLTNNYTDTGWFHLAESACAAICFTRGRIRFESPDGATATPVQGSAFFYYGPHVARFREAFERVGFIR